MKTTNLIAVLAADARPTKPVGRSLVIAGLSGGIVAGLLFVALVGVRSDLLAALANPRVVFKFLFTAVTAMAALAVAARVSCPDRAGPPIGVLLAPLLLLGAATGLDMAVTPRSSWAQAAMGISPLACLTMIVVTSLLPAFCLLWAARAGAPRHPAKAGAAAGLAGGAVGAGIFSFYCPNDSTLFVALWYGFGMVLTTGLAALVGRRFLRW